RNLVALGMATFLILMVAWLGVEVFVVRIRSLLNAVRRVAAGDLAARSGITGGSGEIGELGHAFDEMAQSLEHHRRDVHAHQLRIARLNRVYALLSGINATLVRTRDRDTLYQAVC